MHKIYCLNKISKVGLGVLPKKDYEVHEAIDDAHAILVRSADMHQMELPDSVLAVARAGAGVNNIPLEPLAKKGVVVFNTPGANANAVSELIMTGMLLASRDIYGGMNWVKANQEDPEINKTTEKAKSKFGGTEILGKSIGIIGLGAIGLRLAHQCALMGMKVYGTKRNLDSLKKEELPEHMVLVKTKEEIYETCDFISLNLPYSAESKHMIDKEAIKMMKDGVIILNFARDGLVNEFDVLDAIEAGKVRTYVTDFPNANNAKQDKFIVIPHLGASTEEAEDNCAAMAANQIKDFIENGNIKNSVNFPDINAGPKQAKSRLIILYEASNPQFDIMSKIAETQSHVKSFIHQEKNGYGCAIMDCERDIDKITLDAIFNLKEVIKIREIES
ncbi:MAG: 3-phosphoglycerate dehydrogenase [Acholeplasmataceae bacterium]|nr:3-phosphoglycerate dehydrogenase [Acholeplasmataceae bacterium]